MIFVVLVLGLIGYAIASEGFRRILVGVIAVAGALLVGVVIVVVVEDGIQRREVAAETARQCAVAPPAGVVVDEDESGDSKCAGKP